ncbi:protein-disulfide reductase DsbD family protein [Usitatibacter palustris]|uniref:Thiol:disulfide interchange protein DsbD n=1 Tax=Usitatibacter palustris TaxID=2732487 RepID=A0A6M4HAS7_9PROT|nr:protein-disulfide reductase DsbD domain-containing protein [Usitatibacter palustris]QJR16770.1 Thiol:disulfide interchange protein DsbD [Usitatibacter palustris]
MTFPRLLFPLAALVFAATAHAAPVVKTEHVEAQLLAERTGTQPGKPSMVGLRLRMAPHWHTYWKNPGDSGLPTKIQWTLPEGWTAGPIQWPYPKNLPIGHLLNYGYEEEVVLLVELTPPASAKPGMAAISAKADWLVCKDVCIPENGTLDLNVNVASAEGSPDNRWQLSFERARGMLPAQPSGWVFAAASTGKTVTLKITPPAGTPLPAKATFFPDRDNVIEHAAPQKSRVEGNSLLIEMKHQDPVPKDFTTLAGVAVADRDWPGIAGRKAVVLEAAVSASAAPAAAAQSTSTTPGSGGGARSEVGGSVLVALVFALVGGMLLNLMPCVFPVLGIKVLGFVGHAHGDAKALRMQGLVFSAGVLASFLVLAGLMLALRAGGTQLGWGFQLQSPMFVTLLAGLFFVLALNLSGVFEWGLFAQSLTSNVSARGRNADAFLAGVLASVVATPCTAPFMGAAVGFTLAQPAPIALTVFLALGVGMALPVFLLSFFPNLLKKLPRPGPWMETFKQVMAFPLYATVAWLVWVLGQQGDIDTVLGLLLGLVFIAMAAWVYGRWALSEGPWRYAFTALFFAIGAWLAAPGETTARAATNATAKAGAIAWQEWSPQKVSDLVASGQPVFVDFTASWCVTCQVNKRVALNNDGVAKAFADRNVTALKADWTNHDPRITEALARLGRNAVPVYALYVPGQGAPRLLPELLTPSAVLDELNRLPAAPAPATAITQR